MKRFDSHLGVLDQMCAMQDELDNRLQDMVEEMEDKEEEWVASRKSSPFDPHRRKLPRSLIL